MMVEKKRNRVLVRDVAPTNGFGHNANIGICLGFPESPKAQHSHTPQRRSCLRTQMLTAFDGNYIFGRTS